MRWTSRRSSTTVPADILGLLHDFGHASFEAAASGARRADPRFGWDGFFSRLFPACQADLAQVITELDQAAAGDPLARFGAYRIVAEYQPDCADTRYLNMMDEALQMMHDRGLSSGHLTRYEADRWVATHDDLRSSFDHLVEVAPPAVDHAIDLALAPGGTLLVAKMGPGALDNEFWIERAADGSYCAFSMRPKDADASALSRYSEDTIGSWGSVDGVLRSVGEYLRTPTSWAHESLLPYFTQRRTP